MVAPQDLGEAAARRLLAGAGESGIHYIEGPQRYTSRNVAELFAEVLGVAVEIETIPRERWESTFLQLGFRDVSAQSYACMTASVQEDEHKWPNDPERGVTTLRNYIRRAVKEAL